MGSDDDQWSKRDLIIWRCFFFMAIPGNGKHLLDCRREGTDIFISLCTSSRSPRKKTSCLRHLFIWLQWPRPWDGLPSMGVGIELSLEISSWAAAPLGRTPPWRCVKTSGNLLLQRHVVRGENNSREGAQGSACNHIFRRELQE